MIREIGDPLIVNGFANHPEIRPMFGGAQELDLSSAIKAPNVFLFGEHGGFCASWSAPGVFEVHTLIAPEGRGKWAIEAAKQAQRIMTDKGAEMLWTRVHPDARHTALFTRKMGFRPAGTNTLDIGEGPVDWLVFTWRAECQQQ